MIHLNLEDLSPDLPPQLVRVPMPLDHTSFVCKVEQGQAVYGFGWDIEEAEPWDSVRLSINGGASLIRLRPEHGLRGSGWTLTSPLTRAAIKKPGDYWLSLDASAHSLLGTAFALLGPDGALDPDYGTPGWVQDGSPRFPAWVDDLANGEGYATLEAVKALVDGTRHESLMLPWAIYRIRGVCWSLFTPAVLERLTVNDGRMLATEEALLPGAGAAVISDERNMPLVRAPNQTTAQLSRDLVEGETFHFLVTQVADDLIPIITGKP